MENTPTNVASIGTPIGVPRKEPVKPAVGDTAVRKLKQTREVANSKKRSKSGPKPAGERPTKYLPTPRVTFTKQLDILRAWAAASGPTGKVASNDAVADIVKMQPSTVSLANPFFASGGFLAKADGGYIPCAEVTSFLRAYEWSPDTAPQKLAPVVAKTWFAEELLSKLAFGPISEDEAIQDLADAANAAPEYRGQLEILIDYLAAAGLVQRDGSQIRKGGITVTPSAATSLESSNAAPRMETSTVSQEPPKSVPSLFGTTEGAVNFHVSVRVDMGEFANWKPDRIAAFFGGMAQVLAAKAKIEKEE